MMTTEKYQKNPSQAKDRQGLFVSFQCREMVVVVVSWVETERTWRWNSLSVGVGYLLSVIIVAPAKLYYKYDIASPNVFMCGERT